jgi:hypothetical protein
MNGATAELEAKTIKRLIKTSTIIIGAIQYRLLCPKNWNNSWSTESFPIYFLPG